MTHFQIIDGGGKPMNVAEIDGRLYPPFPEESLRNCLNFKARPDDIVLCTYPKSGTHWTFEIMRCLLTGVTGIQEGIKLSNFIEIAKPSDLEDMPSPRNYMFTHFTFDKMSPDFLRHKCKIIHVTRDPRDVAVSYINHIGRMKNLQGVYYEGEWKDFLQLYMKGRVAYGTWFDHTKGWEKGIKEHPDHPFLVLSYDAMQKDPLREIKRLDAFLGTEHKDEFLNEIVEKTRFKYIKEIRPDSQVYRKGVSGDWKNWFTVAQSEYFNQVFEKEMAGTDAYKLYTHATQLEPPSL